MVVRDLKVPEKEMGFNFNFLNFDIDVGLDWFHMNQRIYLHLKRKGSLLLSHVLFTILFSLFYPSRMA